MSDTVEAMMVKRALLVLAILVAGCKVSEEQELKLGADSHAEFEKQSGGLANDPALQAYVSRVGGEVSRYAGRPTMVWQFRVVNSPDVNAFAVPGGYIYITKGLLYRLNNEAQLAGVLGHEAGHIAHRHSAIQIQRAQGANIAAATVGVVGGLFGYTQAADVSQVVAQLTLLKYGRDQETEADYSGLQYMSRAQYNPTGIVQTMQVLADVSGKAGNQPPAYLSSHPDPGNRVQYLTAEIRKTYAAAAQSGRYGAPEFKAAVLDRRTALLPAANTGVWCLTCPTDGAASQRRTRLMAQAGDGGRELMHDAR